MSCRRFIAVTALLLMALVPGCGRKTGLVPPQKLVPVAITDLRYVLDEKGVALRWSFPTKMENGDKLQAIESFEVYRAVIPEAEFCTGCPLRYEEPVEIDGGRLAASGETRTALYTEGYLQSGYRYLYKVRSRAGWWYPSSDSNVVSFVWASPPKAPAGVRIEAGDRSLALSWEPVTENIGGETLEHAARYQVYRKIGNEDFAALAGPVQEAEFTDNGLINAMYYSYNIRALAAGADTVQAGPASQTVSGVPRDLTPPPQPQHLLAVEIPGGVKLVWQSAGSSDLAGYRIYRREEKSAAPEFIAEVKPGQSQYIDRFMSAGKKWYYTVTSFDAAQPVNESLPAGEAVVDLR